jgi:PII-like signaling protein
MAKETTMADWEISGRGVRVRAYFGERDRHQGKPLWSALLEFLRGHHAAGATVERGIAGYGATTKIHAASLVDLSADLPLVLEWIDAEEVVAQLLPGLEAMLQGGMITTDPVTIIRYQPHPHGEQSASPA